MCSLWFHVLCSNCCPIVQFYTPVHTQKHTGVVGVDKLTCDSILLLLLFGCLVALYKLISTDALKIYVAAEEEHCNTNDPSYTILLKSIIWWITIWESQYFQRVLLLNGVFRLCEYWTLLQLPKWLRVSLKNFKISGAGQLKSSL